MDKTNTGLVQTGESVYTYSSNTLIRNKG